MSTELLGLVWPLQLPPTQKVVLLAVADRVHRDGQGAGPAIATLALDTCLAVRTVRTALRGLEDAGLIFTRLRVGTSSYYVPNVDRLEDLHEMRRQARREALAAASAVPMNAELTPAGDAGVPRQEMPGGRQEMPGGRQELPGGAAGDAGEGGSSCRQTLIPNTNTSPHTPQPSAGGLSVPAEAVVKTKPGREPMQAVELATWLAAMKAAGEDAIPAGDPVYAYAERVGISREHLALCWREFKRQRMVTRKRQKDWRQTFRNCVEGCWYRLWFLSPGEPSRLTSKGEQVRRFFEAEDAAGAAGEA